MDRPDCSAFAWQCNEFGRKNAHPDEEHRGSYILQRVPAEVPLHKLRSSGKWLRSQRSHDIEDNRYSQTNHHPGYGRGIGLGTNSLSGYCACGSRGRGCWFWCRHEEVPKSVLIKVTGRSADSAEAPRRARPSKCYNRHGRQSRLSPTLVISVTGRHSRTGSPVVRLTRRQRRSFPEIFSLRRLAKTKSQTRCHRKKNPPSFC